MNDKEFEPVRLDPAMDLGIGKINTIPDGYTIDSGLTNVTIREHGKPQKFQLGDKVRKTKGSQWHGKVVGTYSTTLTPEGYAVESSTEIGSVQIYPAAALEKDE